MYMTTYHRPTVTGMTQAALIKTGEAFRGEDNTPIQVPVNRVYMDMAITNAPRPQAGTSSRSPLLARIDGMCDAHDVKPVVTHYSDLRMSASHTLVEKATLIGHIVLHYLMPHQSGQLSAFDGLLIPHDPSSSAEMFARKEAYLFALGFLLPDSVMRRATTSPPTDILLGFFLDRKDTLT